VLSGVRSGEEVGGWSGGRKVGEEESIGGGKRVGGRTYGPAATLMRVSILSMDMSEEVEL